MRSVVVLLFTASLFAQSEDGLRRFFEGRQVRVKLDLPGTHLGVDVHWKREPALDFKSYSQRLRAYGRSLADGDTTRVTGIRLNRRTSRSIAAGAATARWATTRVRSTFPRRQELARKPARKGDREGDRSEAQGGATAGGKRARAGSPA